ncbi:MAG: helix-turn-helix domain-containing protein [Lachnospiraceae bacterium]|nr:helix-turn-helix domain-containing protein [Lachnospiraceae bacterium]
MIDALLAKKFIERITQYTEYNINIMDEKGIIIASKNTSRIGTFHEVAFQIIQGSQDTIIVDNERTQFGVKKGVNMAIYYKKKKEGVIGITGEPEEVKPIALVIKMAVEVMLEHELVKYERMKRRNLKEQLLNIILYKEDLQKEDWIRFTRQLQLKEDIIRIPILLSIEGEIDSRENVLSVFRNSGENSSQDLICLTRDGDILLYKALKENVSNLMSQYKYEAGEAISNGLRYMRSAGYDYTVYVGALQSSFWYYRMGYEHCLWLKKTMGKGGSFYFYEHSSRYFMSTLPLTELQVAYYTIEIAYGDKFVENFKEIIGALRNSNFNLNDASKLIHVHKNTLIYRLDKIREALNADPLGNSKDREFVNGFYYYLKRKEQLYKG